MKRSLTSYCKDALKLAGLCLLAGASVLSLPAQDFNLPEEETAEENVELQRSRLVIKVRPAAMIISPATWAFWRNANFEAELGLDKRFSLSFGFNAGFAGTNFLEDSTSSLDTRFASFRADLKYYFPQKKPKPGYYGLEGFYLGGYYKWSWSSLDYYDPIQTDVRGMGNVLGVLAGYQAITKGGFVFSPMVGFGGGLASYTNGTSQILLDLRAGLSIGFRIF